MKTVFLLLIAMASIKVSAQSIDSIAVKMVEANAQVISNYLNKKESSLQKIADAVAFFTELTGISSEADGTYYGQYHPTVKDLEAWNKWLLLNRQYLFWDKEIKYIILYKKVRSSLPG